MMTKGGKLKAMTEAEREVVHLRCERDRLLDIITGQPSLDEDCAGEMELQLTRDQGYWRLGRSRNGDYWVRWKWTGGPYEGHYCIGGNLTLHKALLACLDDILKVERGLKTPPYDSPAPGRKDPPRG